MRIGAQLYTVRDFCKTPEELAEALARVAEILGIPREETIAIGDGENDISMLRWAGLGIAMANAPENVKAAADVIAPACDEDGAAWAMEKYLL